MYYLIDNKSGKRVGQTPVKEHAETRVKILNECVASILIDKTESPRFIMVEK